MPAKVVNPCYTAAASKNDPAAEDVFAQFVVELATILGFDTEAEDDSLLVRWLLYDSKSMNITQAEALRYALCEYMLDSATDDSWLSGSTPQVERYRTSKSGHKPGTKR